MLLTGSRFTRVVAARDPGHARLVRASAITGGLLGSVLAGVLIVHLFDAHAGLLAASVFLSLQAGNLAKDRTPRARLLTTVLLAPTLAGVILIADALTPIRALAVLGFVLMSGLAIWVRRFGPRAAALGTIAFIGYFFTLFMRPEGKDLWALVLIGVFAVVPQILVRLLLLIRRPRRELRVLLQELRAASAAVLQAAAAADHPGQIRFLLARADEIGIAVNQWQSAHETAAYVPCSADEFELLVLNARVDTEAAARELIQVHAAHTGRGDVSGALSQVIAVLTESADSPRAISALAWAQSVTDGRGGSDRSDATLLLARAALAHHRVRVLEFATLSQPTYRPQQDQGEGRQSVVPSAQSGTAPMDQSGVKSGRRSVRAWRAWRSWAPSSRMAVQAMIAATIASGVGEAISASRWYWAVMTAFVIFIGASSRGTILTRAYRRVAGTIGGILVGTLAVFLVGDSQTALTVIALLAVFGMLYFGPLNYIYATLCITTMLVAIYRMLGILDPQLLELRAAETLSGAMIGVLCAYLIFSASSRPELVAQVSGYFDALDALLKAVIDAASKPGAGASVDAAGGDLTPALRELESRQHSVDQSVTGMSTALALRRAGSEAEAVHLMYVTTRAAARLIQASAYSRQPPTVVDAIGAVRETAAVTQLALLGGRRDEAAEPEVQATEGPGVGAQVQLDAAALGSEAAATVQALATMDWALRKMAGTGDATSGYSRGHRQRG